MKIRNPKSEIRKARICGIPTGFWNKAQGCEERATLGHRLEMNPNPNGVVSFNAIWATQPRWGCFQFCLHPQGSSFLTTLGCVTQSLWDWRSPADKIQTTALNSARHASYVVQVLLLFPFLASAQSTTNDIPPLRPALPEIAPTLWEQHGFLIVMAGVVVIALTAAAIVWLLQPKPPVPVLIETQTRNELELLNAPDADGKTISRVSQVLKHYIAVAFELPPGEMTTVEFSRAVAGSEKVGRELATSVSEFLRQCDEQKFLPNTGVQASACSRALELVEQGEARRAELRQVAKPT